MTSVIYPKTIGWLAGSIGILCGFSNLAWGETTEEYLLRSEPPGAISAYAKGLEHLLRQWPPLGVTYPETGSDAILLKRIETPGNPFAIGFEVTMTVNAPLEAVEKVLDDKEHYADLFPSFENIRVMAKEGPKSIVYWEKSAPIFLVPNIKYALIFTKDGSIPGRIAYKTQLRFGNYLKYDDALLVVERDPKAPEKTRYTEYVFYDAKWGAATSLFPGKIWKSSVEGFLKSDMAIRFRAEHPDWEYKKIDQEAEVLLDHYPVDTVLASKKECNPFVTADTELAEQEQRH